MHCVAPATDPAVAKLCYALLSHPGHFCLGHETKYYHLQTGLSAICLLSTSAFTSLATYLGCLTPAFPCKQLLVCAPMRRAHRGTHKWVVRSIAGMTWSGMTWCSVAWSMIGVRLPRTGQHMAECGEINCLLMTLALMLKRRMTRRKMRRRGHSLSNL